MAGLKICIYIALLLITLACLAESKPLLWDLLGLGRSRGSQDWYHGRGRSYSGRSYDNSGQDDPVKSYGDMCRTLNPTGGWSADGTFTDPGCPY